MKEHMKNTQIPDKDEMESISEFLDQYLLQKSIDVDKNWELLEKRIHKKDKE